MKKRDYLALVTTISFFCASTISELLLWNYLSDYLRVWYVAVFLTMSIVYTALIIRLNQVMNDMIGDFSAEISSVNKQFFTFLLVYVCRFLWGSSLISEIFVLDISDYA